MGSLKLNTIIYGLFLFAFVSFGCSEAGLPTGPTSDIVVNDDSGDNGDDSDELAEDHSIDGSEESSDDDSDSNSVDNTGQNTGSDTGTNTEAFTVEYTFDDISIDCGWDSDTFPNPYGKMSFDEQPRWSLCSGSGVGRMSAPVINPMDSRYYRPDTPHTTVVNLEEPVDTVTLHTANHRADRSTGEYYSALIAYDQDGNEIARDENHVYYLNNNAKATRLTVAGADGQKIYSFGLSSLQNASYFDNIKLISNGSARLEALPDTTPPEIQYNVEHEELWPPNHRMERVVSGITADDDSGGPVDLSVSVESNEPVNGEGDGDTTPDWMVEELADGTVDVYVRAERSGLGNGRVYTISIRAEDTSGNVSEAEVKVSVPHHKGGEGRGRGDEGDSGNNGNNGNNGN